MRNLNINNITPVQENFMGNGAIYHGYAGMPDDAGRVYTEEQCALEAKRVGDMKLKIARTFYRWWAWDKDTNTWNWDNEIMTPFYKWLQRMKDLGVVVALNTGWWLPNDLLIEESPFFSNGDWEISKQKYADFVSETVHQLIELRGFDNIKILVMFTEPDDKGSRMVVEGHNQYTLWYSAVKAAHETLIRDGRRNLVKLMGPNEGSTTTSVMVKWLSEQNCDFIDIYSSHNYLFTPQIKYGVFDEDTKGLNISKAGGRFNRIINLNANTEYTVNLTYQISIEQENPVGKTLIGVFEDIGNNDIYNGETQLPVGAAEENSLLKIDAEDITDGVINYTYKFKATADKTAYVGAFYDIKTPACFVVTKLEVLDENGISLYDNADFSKLGEGWNRLYSADYFNDYSGWYKWSKTGMSYVPDGKPYIFDEYNSLANRDYERVDHAADIITGAVALMNSGAAGTLIWTIFDQQWPNSHNNNNDSFVDGDHRCGFMEVLTRSVTPYRSYYAFTLLSRYVDGNGTQVFEGSGDSRVYTTMSVSKEGEITIVVVNNKHIADDFTINFEKSLNGISLNRHYFDPNTLVPDEKAEIIKTDKVFENVTTVLTDKIAPYGVIVYTTHND